MNFQGRGRALKGLGDATMFIGFSGVGGERHQNVLHLNALKVVCFL
jgi:hypothetical protein